MHAMTISGSPHEAVIATNLAKKPINARPYNPRVQIGQKPHKHAGTNRPSVWLGQIEDELLHTAKPQRYPAKMPRERIQQSPCRRPGRRFRSPVARVPIILRPSSLEGS